METLAEISDVRKENNLPAEDVIPDGKLEAHLISAGIEVRRLLGEEVYETLLEEESETDEQKLLECKKAEAILAMAYAVPALNIETSGSGIVTVKGWDETRSELMSQRELDQMITRLRDTAMLLLSPYLLKVDDDTDDEDEQPIVQAGGVTFIAI